MDICIRIRRQIDEADQPDSLDFETIRHTEACGECLRFADDRHALRRLLASESRVSAPANFDAMLRARLRERVEQKPSWLSPAAYLRVGAATAALLVAVVAGQQYGLFRGQESAIPSDNGAVELSNGATPSLTQPDQHPESEIETKAATTVATGGVRASTAAQKPTRPRRHEPVYLEPEVLGYDNVGVGVLVMGENGERVVRVPPVSAGAQLPLYVNPGNRKSAKAVQTSF
jgi:hypothetical protein